MRKWFENMRITRKLIVGYAIVALFTVITGVFGIFSVLAIRDRDARLYRENTLGLQYAGDAAVEFMQIRYNSLRRLYAADRAALEQVVNELNNNFSRMDGLLAQCREPIGNPDINQLLDRIQADWDTYKPAMQELNKAVLNGAEEVMDPALVNLGYSLRNNFLALLERLSEDASATAAENSMSARNAAIIILAVIAVSIALSVALGLFISGIIGIPIQKFAKFGQLLAVGDMEIGKVMEDKDTRFMTRKDEVGELAIAFARMTESTLKQISETKAIASGDLTTSVTVRSENDTMGKSLAAMVEGFNSLATAIVSAAGQVDSGARLVAESSTALAQGSAEQASSIEELTASLEEITTQTNQNAQNAKTADDLTRKIKNDAEAGNVEMAEMLRAMNEINSSSENISKIIKAIEDIAFQTNILALNAAVEAARAGQYGKGFAVVAEEVKNLAAQSAKAAKETTDLIERSIKSVEAGTKIANTTASTFGKILADVSKASDLVGNIATASNEQAMSLEQINQGIMQVSQVVQNNAAASEESAAASEELRSQAESLKASVSVFKLKSAV